MNNSIIFFDSSTKLINPNDEEFKTKKLVELYLDDKKKIDELFSEFIEENLNSNTYTNIFIPLCFGKTLSDFLGLRFATHVRCTQTINQNVNIFIYSFVGIKDLFSNECFNILKTEGIFFIDYDVDTILKCCNEEKIYLSKNTIVNEIKKLNLQIPTNYEDNHSIANEWAIYRWAQTIDTNDDGIEKITDILNSNLYFKYLKTIYPISHLDRLDFEKLKINFEGQANILYIDDEAEKGWKEIFETIFLDNNENIDFTYLDNELNEKTKDEICDLALQTIKDEDIDLVILDFRLHKDDFGNANINDVTGYQILKKIKEYNKGIQVIIFSATNKIWNLQALQEAGADGFIMKESPENSIDTQFTKQSIENLINTLGICMSKMFFKNIYSVLTPLIEKVEVNKNKQPNNYNLKIQQGKLINYLDYLKSADLLLYSNPNNLKYTFLQLILIIEDIIKSFYINSNDGNHYIELNLTNKILGLEKNNNQIILKLNPLERWNKFSVEDYLIENSDEYKIFNNQADRIPFNYRLHCVLYFKYKIDLQKSQKYSQLYRLRSSSVAHIGDSEVKKEDILTSIELLNLLFE